MRRQSLIMKNTESLFLDLDIDNEHFFFASSVATALANADTELQDLNNKLNETLETIKKLTSECDKVDYALSASSGALCSIIDIFLVGEPGESPLENITDKWFENKTKDFAKLCCPNKDNSTLSSAIKNLEKKFKIPYDQRGAGDTASEIFGLNPKNHHFKSLAHNPSLCGLFFSILDQFANTSHFISDGELISLQEADGKFKLMGNNVPSKIFCAFANWIGHLISDMSGSSSSKGRGMGIPSPLWSWTNDVIAIKETLKIPAIQFDKSMNELALKIYKEGYDVRFQSAQAIPVFINEMVVRYIYTIRRLIQYFSRTPKETRSFSLMWKTCEPFTNATVKRMLTVAHGTFCMIEIGDATVHGAVAGGTFNVAEFVMRLNIVGVGRFAISLYGETKRGIQAYSAKDTAYFITREKTIVVDYIEGLKNLSDIYDDKYLLTFIDDLKCSSMYIEAFEKSVALAEKRSVPKEDILRTKSDIDIYFCGGR